MKKPTTAEIVLLTPEALEIIFNLHVFFQDFIKIHQWLITKNLGLGGMRPIDLINIGRGKKVLTFVVTALDENKPITKIKGKK